MAAMRRASAGSRPAAPGRVFDEIGQRAVTQASYRASLFVFRDIDTVDASVTLDREDDAPAIDTELLDIIRRKRLHPVFQPIMDFRARAYIGFEGLIRGPVGSPLHTPGALFAAARAIGRGADLEHACRETILRAFAGLRLPGKLFLNVTPGCLKDERMLNGATRNLLLELKLSPGRIVIELTENQQITDIPEINAILAIYRARGFQIAIDDLGEGFANLRMWSEVRPDFVKIDRHFIHGIADDRMKFHFVRAMQDIAEISAAQIVAEGIEREEDFNLLRDMGIACGQGFFLARPAAVPPSRPTTQAMAALEKARIALSPVGALGGKPVTAEALLRPIEPVSPDTLNERVIDLFKADAQLDVLPVVQDGNPLGLINRYTILDRFARPFTHELFGRRSCTQFMDPAPMVVDHLATVQEISLTLARSEKHHLFDGFIITAGGRYRGVGSSHDLMAMITEMQISAARYSNPLTHLPGNVPINEHIDRLLENRVDFVACYADIDNFKPYNDTFGYREGDEIIQGLSRLVREHCDARLDFVGHIGGDDFFVLFQSRDWEVRCRNLVSHFTAYIETLLGPSIKAQGGFVADNRRGDAVLFPPPSLSIGAVRIEGSQYESHREVSAAAAAAKKHAKKMGGGTLFVERRQLRLAHGSSG